MHAFRTYIFAKPTHVAASFVCGSWPTCYCVCLCVLCLLLCMLYYMLLLCCLA